MYLCGIIKPHATVYREDIMQLLKHASVGISKTKSIWYSRELVDVLYDHMSVDARSDIFSSLEGNEGLALLLVAESIEYVRAVVGTESNPSLCKKGTIRELFGMHGTASNVGGEEWWENAFHRPIDIREATRDLRHIWNI